MAKNKLLLSSPGSGKTTLIVRSVLDNPDRPPTLITTYTESNAEEIRHKFIKENKAVPANVTILTWFSFLLKHGVRPYQYSMDDSLKDVRVGFYLTSGRSGFRFKNSAGQPIYWGEANFKKFYFTKDHKIYSDKISRFVYVCNKDKVNGELISRVSRIFEEIYVDEVQDLAGWDLEILLLLMKSEARITLVGDPKQTVYSTNDSGKHKKYRGGKISLFLEEKAGSRIEYDTDSTTLLKSHRNNQPICDFASLLYPDDDPSTECDCEQCSHNSLHDGVYLVAEDDVSSYLEELSSCKILRWSGAGNNELTFGTSKGTTFDHVLIWPTAKITEYLKSGDVSNLDSDQTLAKFYVAITRARYSVAIVYDHRNEDYYDFNRISAWSSNH